jgi:hypothetical protein
VSCRTTIDWLKNLTTSDVSIVTQNGLYDFGWLRSEADIRMPPSERLEEIGALATMVASPRQPELRPRARLFGRGGVDADSATTHFRRHRRLKGT